MLVVPPRPELRRRLPPLLAGIVVLGIGLSLMVRARLGLGPWEVLHQGISRHTGIAYGTVGILVGIPVFVAWIPLRQRVGVGTVVNVVFVGLTVDAVLGRLPEPSTLAGQALCLAAGILGIAVGAGIYIGAGLGPGPRDGLMTGLAARGHSLRLVRTLIEFGVLGAGWGLGGDVGVGTLLFALGVGPLVQLTLGRFTLEPSLTAPGE